MSAQSRSELTTYATDNFADNDPAEEISEQDLRDFAINIIDSVIIKDEAGDLGAGLGWADSKIIIATAGVTSAMLRNSSGRSVIGRALNSTGVPADIVATAGNQILRVDPDGGQIRFSTISGSMIDNGSIQLSRLQNIQARRVLGNITALTQGVSEELISSLAPHLELEISHVDGLQDALDGAVIGPSSVTGGNPAVFSGTSGKLISEVTFAAFKTSLAITAADVGYTAADVLAKLLTVDGAGSGLDADLLDGQSSAYYLDAANLTGTIADARISGAYTGITSLTMSSSLLIGGGIVGTGVNIVVRPDTSDASDDKSAFLAGGGAVLNTRGGYVAVYGNEHATRPGQVTLVPGSGSTLELMGATNIAGDLIVTGQVQSLGSGTAFYGQYDDGGATGGPHFILRRASPSPAANDIIGGWFSQGMSSTGVARTYAAYQVVLKTVTNGAEDGQLQIQTIQAGALGARLLIDAGLHHALATGGDKGNGTLNMDGVFDDNVLLTCIPLQAKFLARKVIDIPFWDAKASTSEKKREHKVARLFKKMVTEEAFDPRDYQNYIDRMEADEALPGMPTKATFQQNELSIGEYTSRQWLASELLAVAFRSFVQNIELRVTAVEKKLK